MPDVDGTRWKKNGSIAGAIIPTGRFSADEMPPNLLKAELLLIDVQFTPA